MSTEKQRRIWELALENLENKKLQIDLEIADLRRELQRGVRKTSAAGRANAGGGGRPAKRKRARFSKEERLRRAARMKAYWENWRKQHGKKHK
jgi:hypothetical protein